MKDLTVLIYDPKHQSPLERLIEEQESNTNSFAARTIARSKRLQRQARRLSRLPRQPKATVSKSETLSRAIKHQFHKAVSVQTCKSPDELKSKARAAQSPKLAIVDTKPESMRADARSSVRNTLREIQDRNPGKELYLSLHQPSSYRTVADIQPEQPSIDQPWITSGLRINGTSASDGIVEFVAKVLSL
ncbi:MAG: hypothetical protein OXU45_00740 [Candidatus Melainabacteria bacterium]|nr:hypothetical protein [Candidatus Melainabacteria bacterium]